MFDPNAQKCEYHSFDKSEIKYPEITINEIDTKKDIDKENFLHISGTVKYADSVRVYTLNLTTEARNKANGTYELCKICSEDAVKAEERVIIENGKWEDTRTWRYKKAVSQGNEYRFAACASIKDVEKKGIVVEVPKEEEDCAKKFKTVSPVIFENEGGYVNNPNDKGGPTNKGIAWNTWQQYAKQDLGIEPTLENLKNITEEQASKIYNKRYWEPRGFCKIKNAKIALMIYDWTITSGSIPDKKVQELLVNEFGQNIAIDGAIGSKTIEAINSVTDQDKLLNRIAEIRKNFYYNLAYDSNGKPKNGQDIFYKGWINRVNKCLNINI